MEKMFNVLAGLPCRTCHEVNCFDRHLSTTYAETDKNSCYFIPKLPSETVSNENVVNEKAQQEN